jgi:hypothetical protein
MEQSWVTGWLQVLEKYGGASRDRTDDLIVANDGVRRIVSLPCLHLTAKYGPLRSNSEPARLGVALKLHGGGSRQIVAKHHSLLALQLGDSFFHSNGFLDTHSSRGYDGRESSRCRLMTNHEGTILRRTAKEGYGSKNLGAVGYFEKPLDFNKLKRTLAAQIESKPPEHRAHVRVRMRLAIKLRGTDASGRKFEEMTTTENVSAAGFLCNCMSALVKGAIVEVTLSGATERYVGRAMVVRKESSGTPWHRYGFQFQEKTFDWPFQES